MRATTRKLIAIVLLAGVLRALVAIVLEGARVSWSYEYEVIAQNLAAGRGFAYDFYGLSKTQPTSYQPPLYPLFLASLIRFIPAGLAWLAPAQITLSLLSIPLLHALTVEVSGSKAGGLWSAFMLAVYPPLLLYAVLPGPVVFEILFVLSGAYCTLRSRSNTRGLWALGSGISFALAGLTRSPWLLAIPIAGLWSLWRSKDRNGRRWSVPVLILIAAAIVLLPWGLYNHQLHSRFSITSTNGGINFWIGNNPDATGEYIFPTQIDRDLVEQTVDLPEVERDQFFYTRGLEFIRKNPGDALTLAAQKSAYFLFFRPSIGSTYQSSDTPLALARLIFIASWLVLLPMGFVGLWLMQSHWKENVLLAGIFMSQLSVGIIYFVGTRFRTPLDPFFMLWASAAMLRLVTRWRSGEAVRPFDA